LTIAVLAGEEPADARTERGDDPFVANALTDAELGQQPDDDRSYDERHITPDIHDVLLSQRD